MIGATAGEASFVLAGLVGNAAEFDPLVRHVDINSSGGTIAPPGTVVASFEANDDGAAKKGIATSHHHGDRARQAAGHEDSVLSRVRTAVARLAARRATVRYGEARASSRR